MLELRMRAHRRPNTLVNKFALPLLLMLQLPGGSQCVHPRTAAVGIVARARPRRYRKWLIVLPTSFQRRHILLAAYPVDRAPGETLRHQINRIPPRAFAGDREIRLNGVANHKLALKRSTTGAPKLLDFLGAVLKFEAIDDLRNGKCEFAIERVDCEPAAHCEVILPGARQIAADYVLEILVDKHGSRSERRHVAHRLRHDRVEVRAVEHRIEPVLNGLQPLTRRSVRRFLAGKPETELEPLPAHEPCEQPMPADLHRQKRGLVDDAIVDRVAAIEGIRGDKPPVTVGQDELGAASPMHPPRVSPYPERPQARGVVSIIGRPRLNALRCRGRDWLPRQKHRPDRTRLAPY